MAIRILILTDNTSNMQGIIDAMESRRAVPLVHPLDVSLLPAAREAAPAAILLDVKDDPANARVIQEALAADDTFSSIPLFGMGGPLPGATSDYEELDSPSSIAAEILGVAELTYGFGGNDDDLFDDLGGAGDIFAPLGGAGSAPPPPKAPPSRLPPRRPASPPPMAPPAPPAARTAPPAPPAAPPSTPPTPPKAVAPPAPVVPVEEFEIVDDDPILDIADDEIVDIEVETVEADSDVLSAADIVEETSDQDVTVDTAAADARVDALVAENETLRAEQEALRLQLEQLTSSLQEAQTQGEAAGEQAQKDEARIQDLMEQNTDIGEQLDASLANVKTLEASLQQITEERDALADEKATLEKSSQELITQLETAIEEIQNLEQQVQSNDEIEHWKAQFAGLEAEYDALAHQRDEILQISSELESAFGQSEARAALYVAALEKADTTIRALQEDLGVYAQAAHRTREQHQEHQTAIKALATTLESSLAAARTVLDTSMNALPDTTWESAFNAYETALDALSDDVQEDFHEADTPPSVEVAEEAPNDAGEAADERVDRDNDAPADTQDDAEADEGDASEDDAGDPHEDEN